MEYPTLIWITLFIIFLRFLYSYVRKRYNYWAKRGIPFVPAYPPFGSLGLKLLKDNFHEVELKWYQQYGKLFGFYQGFIPVLMISEPDLLRQILVKDFQTFPGIGDFITTDTLEAKMVFLLQGETWKRIRTILTPAHSSGKIKKMFPIFLDAVTALSKNLSKIVKRGEHVDLKRIYGAFTMDAIASSAFGTKIDSLNDPQNEFVVAARRLFSGGAAFRFIVLAIFPALAKLLGVRMFHPKSMDFYEEVVLKVIEERKTSKNKYNDLLQLVINASEEASEDKETHEKETVEEDEVQTDIGHGEGNEKMFKISNLKYKSLSKDEMIANSIMFFLVGYETTSSVLSFVTYLLALNPACQEKLIAEIDETIRENQNQLNYDILQNMKYLDMVISETLRMYPFAFRTMRGAVEDYKLGDTGLVIEKGTLVAVPVYAIHHDPANYPEPEKFDPMRFSPEEKARRDAFTYLPFGAGPRNCLGMRFALIELKLCLAYTFSQFRFKRCSETEIPLRFSTRQGTLQPRNITLAAEERLDKVFNL